MIARLLNLVMTGVCVVLMFALVFEGIMWTRAAILVWNGKMELTSKSKVGKWLVGPGEG